MTAPLHKKPGVRLLALAAATLFFAASPALASPDQCAAYWVERNRPFAERGLCVDTPLWNAVFPKGNCTHATGADISLPKQISERLTELRALETRLGCRMDNNFDDAQASARSLWLEIGDQASIFSAKDGYANLRDAPSAASGTVVGMLGDGSQVRILERVQSPDNGALWFRISYPDNIGRLRNAFVHHGAVFPRREVMGFLDIAPSAQLDLISLGAGVSVPAMLRARFWIEENPSDIWPVLSRPSYSRSGEEQRSFSVAFTALDWQAGDLAADASRCRWQEGKRQAVCAGGAGSFRIIAARDETTGALTSLGLQLDGAAGEELSLAGLGREVIVAPVSGAVQLSLAIDGLEMMKIGVLKLPASAASDKSATPPETAQPAGVADMPVDLPEKAAEALVEFDALIDLIE